ncbi:MULTISPECIES: glycine cleavage system aminomethyltransferase GcvT [Stenotrophomonas]|jgi:aminomethyltransferase|uniref:glycine cleavage system aminomethyltransferase GcvT n=1 Tax=Stenotrophomonas TaxID=40323 RepID=UPI000BD01848|nr:MULTISPECIES: glycine cleavage system aminomethyltransferase GcvT [Stenotrophomonas]MCA7022951.1 glycine cleavage system aminomethyltransferase GcvT [Stenotrophomonas acidaminiphila]MCE4075039.1 glycine cleavage system aminomethyltransferase GcvT [Stenotrophomonas acidaminiphila]OZB54044.1 MAG: glycine cleavage system protein T [Stenotrophomonas sp. 14-69-23]
MTLKTLLNETHRSLGAKMVDFGGWDMPIHYGSQIDEHHLVRRAAGMFDVSHMTVVDLKGERTREFLRQLLANSIDKLKVTGKALYSCMLNAQGGVIDDLIVYFLADDFFRMVVNASTREKDLAWIRQHAQAFGVEVIEREDLAIVAVQGPQARALVAGLVAEGDRAALDKLGRFAALDVASADGVPLFVARTGYTGEDGYEVLLPQAAVVGFWNALLAAGVKPAGLGARDTLRLEAGMNLYGQDMDEGVTPYEAALAWTVALDEGRAFIGRDVLEAQKAAGNARQMIGLVMDDKGVLRHGQKVLTANGEGEILSGTFSPTLGKAIAFARVPAGEPGDVRVDIRGKEVPVRVVKFPFVRDGQPQPGING